MKRNVYYNILLFTACSCLPAVFFISVLEAKRLWSFSFPWHHALAAEAEYKDRLGYVKSFTVNGRSINETLQLYSPTGHDKDLNVSEGYFSSNGILNRFTWEFNDRKDPIFFQMVAAPEVAEEIAARIKNGERSAVFSFRPIVINYDHEKKIWFTEVKTPSNLTGIVYFSGKQSGFHLGATPLKSTLFNNASIPELYELSFYLYPVKDQQKIYLKEYANAKNIGIFGGK